MVVVFTHGRANETHAATVVATHFVVVSFVRRVGVRVFEM